MWCGVERGGRRCEGNKVSDEEEEVRDEGRRMRSEGGELREVGIESFFYGSGVRDEEGVVIEVG